jgi:glycine/D-amino acid oxidase-like deaminating enzyme
VAVIGGGVVGCAAAHFLAAAGASVELFERDEVGSAASGRNSGVLQHPFDRLMAALHHETLRILGDLEGFELDPEPAGVLMLARERSLLEPAAAEITREVPELQPRLLDRGEVAALEPSLAPGLVACRLHTGYPVRPAAVTRALARAAHLRGARFHEHETAWPWLGSGRARGVISGGVRRAAGELLVAAGPWTPELVDPTRAWRPIEPVWGVVAELELAEPPRHVVEEAGIEGVAGGGTAATAIFSAVTADGVTSVGSTFLAARPDPETWTDRLRSAAAAFVPAAADARVTGVRACARPQSLDGRPLVGELPGTHGLWVAAGHGPWGISTGAATGRIAADAILGRERVPAALAVARIPSAL